MFYAVIKSEPPIIAVQLGSWPPDEVSRKEMLMRLERHFMVPVRMVNWDESGEFRSFGSTCPEDMLTDEDMTWRKLDLPAEPEVPF
jgi:hypothetical protein